MNEIKRMQQLAGIITEIKVNNPSPIDIKEEESTHIDTQNKADRLVLGLKGKNLMWSYPPKPITSLSNPFNSSPWKQKGNFQSFDVWIDNYDGTDHLEWLMTNQDELDEIKVNNPIAKIEANWADNYYNRIYVREMDSYDGRITNGKDYVLFPEDEETVEFFKSKRIPYEIIDHDVWVKTHYFNIVDLDS